MKVSNYPDFNDSINWIPYAGSLDWDLKGEINKNNLVYVKFKNLTGGESAVANDSIKLVDKLSSTSIEKEPAQVIYNYYIIKRTETVLNSTNVASVPHIVSPTSGALVLDNSIYLTGFAEPNSLITLSIHSDNQIIAKVVSDNSGKFIYKIEPNILESGKHTVYATIEKDNELLVGPTTHFEIFSEDRNSAIFNTNEGITLITNVEPTTNNSLLVNINILNFEGEKGEILFNIKNYNGKLVSSYNNTFKTTSKDINFTKSIKTAQELEPGKYIFETQLNSEENKNISNVNGFEIKQNQYQESFYSSSAFKFIILLWIILIGMIIWGVRKIIILKK